MANHNQKRHPHVWVLYDNQCGFCSKWVQFWRRTLAKRGIGVAGLQEPWVGERLKLTEQELLHDIRLLTKDGGLVSGANVYLYVTRRIWWARPFYAVFSLPGFNRLLHAGYQWFARNRQHISHTCRLSPEPQGSFDPKGIGRPRT